MEKTISVLIVEDERLIAMMLRQMLEKGGFTVCGIAPNLSEASRIIETQNPNFALIDIHLENDDNGIELGKHLYNNKIAPFAYLTAYTDKDTYEEAMQTHPVAFLKKPVSLDTVKTIILEYYNHN